MHRIKRISLQVKIEWFQLTDRFQHVFVVVEKVLVLVRNEELKFITAVVVDLHLYLFCSLRFLEVFLVTGEEGQV